MRNPKDDRHCPGCAHDGGAICRHGSGRPGRGQSLAAGQPLRQRGVSPGLYGVLQSGLLRLDGVDLSGRRRMLGLVVPGEPVGDPTGGAAPESRLTAVLDARICPFSAEPAGRLIDCAPEFRHAVLRAFSARLARLQTMMWMQAMLGTTDRVAALLMMASRFMPTRPLEGGGVRIRFVMPRQDAADMIATTTESISRATHELERNGLIGIRDPATFDVFDLARLGERASLDPATLDSLFPRPVIDGVAAAHRPADAPEAAPRPRARS